MNPKIQASCTFKQADLGLLVYTVCSLEREKIIASDKMIIGMMMIIKCNFHYVCSKTYSVSCYWKGGAVRMSTHKICVGFCAKVAKQSYFLNAPFI